VKIQKITFIIYIILAIVIVWLTYDWLNPNYEKCFRQNSEEFAENRIEFEKLIRNIKTQYLKVEPNPNLTELSKKISENYEEELDEIGIESVEISSQEDLNCSEKLTFTFNVKAGYNINKLRNVKIIFSPCNEKTEEDYHSNSNHIDINGEGNNWFIFSDTDYI
jgi:hypothetical protein